jgi:hypothetical protein
MPAKRGELTHGDVAPLSPWTEEAKLTLPPAGLMVKVIS